MSQPRRNERFIRHTPQEAERGPVVSEALRHCPRCQAGVVLSESPDSRRCLLCGWVGWVRPYQGQDGPLNPFGHYDFSEDRIL